MVDGVVVDADVVADVVSDAVEADLAVVVSARSK